MNIFRTFWKSGRELFEELLIVMASNMLWLLVNLPLGLALLITWSLGAIAPLIAVLMLGTLSFGPSNAGLCVIAQRITEGRTSNWRHFVQGMREYAVLSWKIYGWWLLGLVVIIFNLQFYNLSGSQISAFISIVFLYFLIVWCGLLIYIGPLMVLQTDKRVRVIARNAALMTFGRPLFTLGTLILMVLVLGVSIYLVFLAIVGAFAFMALWSFRATLTLIAEAEARQQAAAEANPTGDSPKGRGGQVRPRE